ncbi:MAG: preprotein translocase subunit SecA [Parcubacteria group bacterium CG11_big_fil_rev_8_21_14_0_20_39_22]|nr:MAG: preprotein translocase subunit SecA [Parcubacteria group bacterium CG11_big_fil_rev_8_21_14_0_20_39_22]
MTGIFSKIFGDENSRTLKEYGPMIEQINALEPEISALKDEELRQKTLNFRDRIEKGESLDDILPEAFAVVREASKRTLGQRHFDVQLIGGAAMHKGGIAEMRTGEGKTLVATLPAYLNALTGKGVHVVTVNDYLSRRDAVWMGQIYNFLGLSVGCITSDESYIYDPSHSQKNQESGIKNQDHKSGIMNHESKNDNNGDTDQTNIKTLDKIRDSEGGFRVVHEFLRPSTRTESYNADITYGTNNEFGFDYLRDNISYDKKELRQRDYNFAVVDEIDSILIDEARTPLIISAPTRESEDLYQTFSRIAEKMVKDEDFEVDEKLRAITLKDSGIEKAERALGVENIYTDKGIKYVHHLETAIRARALFEKDKEYVVRDGQVVIVDEFTGRLQPGRRWSEGLHQAIESKEGVTIQKEARTFASITFQNYFRLYDKLSGMTGTAKTSAEEFRKVYGLNTLSIPTNKEIQRIDRGDQIFQTETGKFKAIARLVKELQQKGQPVLIGTVSIDKNELLSQYLNTEGVTHTMLNAKNHEKEGETIAQAGRLGAVTVATNMAGRGVDIKLGGNPATEEEYNKVKEKGGLFVLGTERHEARRIDNQLRGRAGRQGDPGETQFFVSLEDSLMRVFASDTIKKMMGRFGIPEDEPIENRIITRSLESAQTKIEGFNFDSRKHVLQYDDILNRQRQTVYSRRRKILTGDKEDIDEFLRQSSEGKEDFMKVMDEKREELGEEEFYASMRRLILQTIDMLWVEHLEVMDYLRGSVNLRAYGQRDPLIEYKKDGLRLFKEMEESLYEMVARNALQVRGMVAASENLRLREIHENARLIGYSGENSGTTSRTGGILASPKSRPTVDPYSTTGRNDPCPCGSGKKYKKCHGV